jgi:glycosyltransferase involved in cell wall biosynthesis
MFFLNSARIRSVKISAVLIAFNEEKNIRRALESVQWADEILVVDSESGDRTREIAESLGAKVLVQKWLGFAKQKQFAIDRAAHDWIFSLDADEEISVELAEEIRRLKNSSPSADGYKIPRLSFYMNRAIRRGGWYPDWQLRFFNRRKGRWKDVLIHESVEMSGDARIEKLKGDILHYSVENAAHHHRMIGERYAPFAARRMFEGGRRTSRAKIFFAGLLAFVQTYFLKLGFLDGFAGFCIARFAAHHAFLKHLLLWELQSEDRKPKTEDRKSSR